MPDIWLEWNSDFFVSPSGGLVLASGDDFARQRIIRRLMTAIKGYVWHQGYGAGLPQKIGKVANVTALTALVRSQIAYESSVAANPIPVISVDAVAGVPGAYEITINYTDAASGEPVTLTFTP